MDNGQNIREKACCNFALAVFGSIVWLYKPWFSTDHPSAFLRQMAARTSARRRTPKIVRNQPAVKKFQDTAVAILVLCTGVFLGRPLLLAVLGALVLHGIKRYTFDTTPWYNMSECAFSCLVCECLGRFARWSAVSEEDAAAFSVLALTLLGQCAGMNS